MVTLIYQDKYIVAFTITIAAAIATTTTNILLVTLLKKANAYSAVTLQHQWQYDRYDH